MDRKEARLVKEKDARRRARQVEILTYVISLSAESPSPEDLETYGHEGWILSFPQQHAHLAGMPSIAALIDDDEVPITHTVADSKRAAIIEDLRVYRMRVRRNLAGLQRDILSDKKIEEFGTEVFQWFKPAEDENVASLDAEDAANLSVLQQPTCIFSFSQRSFGMYPQIFEDASVSEIVSRSRELQSLAELVASKLGVAGKTLTELRKYQQTFVCDACPEEVSRPLLWADLVSTLYNRVEEVELNLFLFRSVTSSQRRNGTRIRSWM